LKILYLPSLGGANFSPRPRHAHAHCCNLDQSGNKKAPRLRLVAAQKYNWSTSNLDRHQDQIDPPLDVVGVSFTPVWIWSWFFGAGQTALIKRAFWPWQQLGGRIS
jgi:hypothetical protein